MSNYAKVYLDLASRAISQTAIDLETFIKRAKDAGMSQEAIERSLMQDLEEGGPLFGKFLRSLTGSAQSSVSVASRQGQTVGNLMDDPEYARYMTLAQAEDATEWADPDLLEEVTTKTAAYDVRTWIATMKNTCHRCLPLHGRTLTMEEWTANGWLPELMHEGWDSDCQCQLVPDDLADLAGTRKQIVAPLVRNKIKTETGLKPSKRTVRGITQADIDKAIAARDKALDTIEGRRTLRLLGQIYGEVVADEK
jgi:hypothetical protein